MLSHTMKIESANDVCYICYCNTYCCTCLIFLIIISALDTLPIGFRWQRLTDRLNMVERRRTCNMSQLLYAAPALRRPAEPGQTL